MIRFESAKSDPQKFAQQWAHNTHFKTTSSSISSSVNETTLQTINAFISSDTNSGFVAEPSNYREGELDALLFNALASVKRLTALSTPHLDATWRKALFAQLDSVHDPDEWEAGSHPVNLYSYSAFLYGLLRLRPNRKPSVGIDRKGNVTVMWFRDRDQVALLFHPNDSVDWSVITGGQQTSGSASLETIVSRLSEANALNLLR
jgi:hypothetical protein